MMSKETREQAYANYMREQREAAREYPSKISRHSGRIVWSELSGKLMIVYPSPRGSEPLTPPKLHLYYVDEQERIMHMRMAQDRSQRLRNGYLY